jgi:polyferredoxin
MKRRITLARRIVQVACLILLVYGGYLFKGERLKNAAGATPADTQGSLFPALKAPKGAVSTTQFQPGSILWPSGATPVMENYPPGLICRFNPAGGMFKACFLHFISENLTWRTDVKFLLPHITLFVLLCFLLGRVWCGWLCPLGTVGDFITWLRRKMNIPVRRFPPDFRRSLIYSSYGLLALTAGISSFIGIPGFARLQCNLFLPYCQVCPARLLCPLFGLINPSWKDFSTVTTSIFTLLAWTMLGLFTAAFYWGRRVWCHLCPVGLMSSWFNKGAGLELRKDAVKCNKCGSCADACPMGLTKMYEAEENIIYNQNECVMCLRCVEICPRKGCLSASLFGKRLTESKYC